ncbi:uncharacterized protein [Aegilops tauschii subsp. strangulata]|uniref:uncharacterized protein n=1 Tax=Aegilops tauschii subsp. strangulata TaxID=200361 RepID=UPI003CC84A71
MKKSDKFEWSDEAEAAFKELKALLSTQPVLAAPVSNKPLLLYIAATGQVVSTVLTVEREEEGKAFKVQRPVYYISEVLTPSKQRYPHYQKLVYGIYLTMKKVAHYFSDHSISVVSDAPLSKILNNRDATGRVAKWEIELLPLDIKFEAKKAIKSQAIADFLAEWTEQQQPIQIQSKHWTMFFDGSKMLNGSSAGVVLVSPRGDKLSYVLQIHFESSNNEAEYEALLNGLRYCNAVRKLEKKFEGLELHHIPRIKNQAADDLAKIGSTQKPIPSNVFLEHLHAPSVQEDPFKEEPPQPISPTDPTEVEIPAVVDLIMEVLVITPDWTVPYIAYILGKELPEDEDEARQIVRRSKAFTVIKGQLYRESATGVAQRCITPEEGTRVDYASVAHPQSNGQAKRANGLILQGLKPRLMRDLKHAAAAWVNELPLVLWGLRTTPNRSTERTPFFLVYGAEAVLPSDLLHNSPRVELFLETEAEQAREDAVDLLEEECEMALVRSTIYQQDLRRFHARNVRGRAFQEGDLVLRVVQKRPHKLAPAWEGPFIITKVLHNGAYHIYNVAKKIDEPRAWNAELLRPFYT